MGMAKGLFVVEKFTMAELLVYGLSVAAYPAIGWWSIFWLVCGWVACQVISHWIEVK